MKNNFQLPNLLRNITIILSLFISQIAISQPCINPPTANAGANAGICANFYYSLGGSIGGSATSASWNSSGTGTFRPNNIFGSATSYVPSVADITAGSVIITLTTNDPDGAGDCVPAISTMTLTISSSPLNGTYTIDNTIPASCTNFISFASATAYLNTYGVSGNVIFNISPGYTETAPSGGLSLNQCALSAGLKSGSAQTITFQKNGVGANPKITAGTGTGIADKVFEIVGADYVTINGIDIAESVANTTSVTKMEYGYVLYPCSGTDGAQNNSIENCTITLDKTNTNLPAGIAIINNGVTVTASSGADSNNKLYSNSISNVYYGIYCMGYSSSSPYALYDQGNELGAIGQGNSITNFGNAVANVNPAVGIYTKYNNNIIIRGNTINSGTANVNSIRGIFTDRAMHANTTIESNQVTVAIASAIGAATNNSFAIYNLSGGRKNRADLITNTININSNTITNCTYPSTGTSSYYSIWNSADLDAVAVDSLSANNVNINSNIISNNTSACNVAAAKNDSVFIQIFNQWAVNTLNINGNSITGNNYTGTVSASNRGIVTGLGFATTLTNWTQITNIQNNTLTNNNSSTSSATDGGGIYCIDLETFGTTGGAAAGSQYNVTGNTMGSVTQTIAKLGKYRGVLASMATSLAVNISNNKISGVTRSTMTGTFIGFQCTEATGIVPASVTMNADTIITISTGGTAADAFTGINTTGGNPTIINLTNNKISGIAMTGGVGIFTGITCVSTTSPTVNINSNKISSCTLSSSTTGAFNGISNSGAVSVTNVTMDSDTIQNITHTGTGAMTCIAGGNGTSYSITNCRVLTNTKTSTAAGNLICITANGASGSTSVSTYSNNIIKDNTMTGTAGTGSFTGIINNGSPAICNITSNTIDNNLRNSTGSGNLICVQGGSGGTLNFTGNTITNNKFPGTTGSATSTIYGYLNQIGSFTVAENYTGNTFDNLTIGGTGTGNGTVHGIYDVSSGELAVKTISGNTFSRLQITAPMAFATVDGINIIYGANISKNKIYTLSANGTGGTVMGIVLSRGDVTISNNYVGDLTASASTSSNAVSNLTVTGNFGHNLYVYFNTFKIDATSGSGNQFGTSNIWVQNAVTTITLRNNILINLASPGGTGGTNGTTVCLRRPDAVGMTSAYSPLSNNNIFYAGTPGSNNLLYLEGLLGGVTGKQTIADLQAYATGRETLSKTENVAFLSNTPSNASYLHVDSATPTFAESGGVNISGITTDWDNDIRQGNPGYAGTGFAPDMGADEFGGTTNAPVISNVSATPSGSVCSGTSSRAVSADVTTATGTITSVTLNYSFNGIAQTPVSMTNTSGNTWTGTIGASSPSNAAVAWSVTATNSTPVSSIYSSSYADDYQANFTTTASATPGQICNGSSSNLAVSTVNIVSTNLIIGNLTSATISNGSPFKLGNFGNGTGNPPAGNKVQFIYLGSELQAAGLIAGNITSMGFYIPNNTQFATNVDMPSFTVKIGTTSLSNLFSTNFQLDPSNVVYGPANTPSPTAPGLWTLYFTTPFYWDGTSNIIIQYCNDAPAAYGTSLSVYGDGTAVYKGTYNTSSISSACSATTGTALQSGRPTIVLTGNKMLDLTSSINYLWNPGALSGSSQVVSPSSTTLYSVTGTDANGCTVTATPVSLMVNPIPTSPVANNSQQCGTQTPSASVTGSGGTFNWYLASTGGTALAGQSGSALVNYPISATTTFYVSESSNGCESQRSTVIAEVNQQPDSITASASGNNICPFTNVNLSVTKTGSANTYVYSWTASPVSGSGIPTSVTGNPATIQATTSGTYVYTVTGTDASAGCATTSTVSVTYINPPYIPNATALPASLCEGENSTLNANAYSQVSGTLASPTSVTNNGLQGSSSIMFDIKNTSAYPVTIHHLSFGAYVGSVGSTFNETVWYKPGGINCVTPTTSDYPFTWTLVTGTPVSVSPVDFGSNGVKTTIPVNINITIPVGQTYAFAIQGAYIAYNTTATTCSTSVATDGNIIITEAYGGATAGFSLRRWTGDVTYDYRVTNSNYTYSWSPAATLSNPDSATTTASPVTSTTYSVQVTDPGTSCSNFGSVAVTVIPLASAPAGTDGIAQCGYGVPNCSVTGSGGTFNWYIVPSGGTALPGEHSDHLTSYSISTTTTFYVSEVANGCEGPRGTVVQPIGGADPIQASTSFPTCFNDTVHLTVAKTSNTNGNNYLYTWSASPYSGSGLSTATVGDTSDGHIDVIPTINNGTYIYTVSGIDSVTGCNVISTITVTVTGHPVISSVSATPNPVCSGGDVTLTALANVSGTYTGTVGTSLNISSAGNIGPFPALSESFRIQYLVRASELTASGVLQGNINQVSFILSSTTPTVDYSNYTISMNNTASSILSSGWESGLTTVYGPVTIPSTSIVAGVKTFNLTTPFAWDGVSNLVIDICYSNDPTGSCNSCYNFGSSVFVQYTSTLFNSVHYNGVQDASNCGATPAGTFSTIRPNMIFAGNYVTGGAGSNNWVWNPGNLSGNVQNANPVSSTIYTVTASAFGSGCSTSTTDTVTTISLTSAPIANGPSDQCGTHVPTASVTGSGGIFNWYTVPTGGTAIPNETGSSLSTYAINTTTTFYVSEFDGQCESMRTPVIANVSQQPDAVTASSVDSSCANSSLTLNVSHTGSTNTYSYAWTASPVPGSGLSSSTAGDVTDGHLNIVPTAGGTYVYTVTATDAGCVATSTISIKVIAVPHIDVVSTSSNPICSGYTATLTGKTSVSGVVTGAIGSGTNTLSTTVIPFASGTETVRTQYLISASELQSAGLTAGNITKISFLVNTVTNPTVGWDSYTIKMGATLNTALTTTFESASTIVYGPVNLAATSIVPGANTFILTSSFAWNGTSNLVVDICWANDPTNVCTNCNSAATIVVPSTTTAFNSVHVFSSSNTSNCGVTSGGTTPSANRPNMILEESYLALSAGSYNWQWNPGAINSNVANVNPTSATIYTVTATDPSTNCTSTATINQGITPGPTAPVGTPSSQCGFGVPLCSVTSSGGLLNWYTVPTGGTALSGEHGNQLVSHTISTTTTFYVSEFDGTCEGPRGMVVASITAPDSISASAPASVCVNSLLSLTSVKTSNNLNNIYSYSWSASPSSGSGISVSTPGQNINVTPTIPGNYVYQVTATDITQGCSAVSTVSVTVQAPPSTPTPVASPSIVCLGNSSTLNANSYNYTSATVSTPRINSTSVAGGSYMFNVDNTSLFPLTIHNFSVLTYSNSTSATVYYSTSPLSSCSTPPNFAGFLTIGTTAIVGQGTSTMTLIPLNLNITIPPGQTYSFAISVNGILYSGGSGTGTTCPVLNYDANLAIHEGFGGTLAVPAPGRDPILDVSYDITVGSPNYTYAWTPPATLNDSSILNPVATPSVNTTYTVVVTDPATSCTSSGSVAVNIGGITSTPVIYASNNTICNSGITGLSVTLPDSGVIYTWQSSSSGNSGTWTTFGNGYAINSATLTTATYFRVYASCGAVGDTSASVFISVDKPNVDSVTGGNRCGAGLVNLQLSGTGNFDWYLNSSGGIPVVLNSSTYSPVVNSNTIYWVQAYIGTCLNPVRQAVQVTITPAPVISIASNQGTTFCNGTSVTLTATSPNDPNYSYSWSTDGGITISGTGSAYTFSPSSSVTVYAYAIDSTNGSNAGCGTFNTTDLSVNETPDVPVISPANATICTTGGCTNLTVTNPATGNTPFNVGPHSLSIGTTGIDGGFNLIFTVTQTMTIQSVDVYFAASVGSNYIISIRDNSNGFAVFTYPGSVAHSGIAIPDVIPLNATLAPGTYRIGFDFDPGTYNNINGPVFPYTVPGVMSIIGTDVGFSLNYYFYFYNWHITIPESSVYTWNPGGLNGTSQTVCPTSSTTYTVSASFLNGCNSSATVDVNYAPITPVVITPSGSTTICPGSSVTLDAGAGYSSYSWSDGASVVGTSQTYLASPGITTDYTVTVSNGICSDSASQLVTVQPLTIPTISPAGPVSFCDGGFITLDAGAGYSSYSWSDGTGVVGTSQTYNATSAGTYTVTVSGNGCTASDSIVVFVNPNPVTPTVTPAGPVSLCDNGSNSPVTLTADTSLAGQDMTILWNDIDGTTTSSIQIDNNALDLLLNGNTFTYVLSIQNSITGCTSNSNGVTVNLVSCSMTLNMKMYIEGFYSGSGLMQNGYNGINNVGCLNTDFVGLSPNSTDVDTIRVTLMDPVTYSPIETAFGILQTDGNVTLNFSSAAGSYYLMVQHRNTLETWSASAIPLSGITTYDFTDSASKAYGSNQQDLGDGNFGFFSGDIADGGNALGGIAGLQDGIVESADYGDMENAVYFTFTGYAEADVTGDGIVESADYGLMENAVYFTRVVSHP